MLNMPGLGEDAGKVGGVWHSVSCDRAGRDCNDESYDARGGKIAGTRAGSDTTRSKLLAFHYLYA